MQLPEVVYKSEVNKEMMTMYCMFFCFFYYIMFTAAQVCLSGVGVVWTEIDFSIQSVSLLDAQLDKSLFHLSAII